jgi:adenosylcobinamide-GDP ribazoletransferase
VKGFLIALQFLTIIPAKKNLTANETDIAKSASFFVVVGIFQGIMLIAADFTLGTFFHHNLVIGLLLLLLIISNGGFHLDGLSDTFDAIAVKSSGNADTDIQKRLSVMKDSASGPAGVTAIICALGIKYLSLENLSHFPYFVYYSSLLLMPIMSKWTMVLSMYYGTPARQDGLGKIFIGNIGLKEIAVSTLTLLLVIALLPVLFSSYMPPVYDIVHYFFYPVLLLVLYLFVRASVIFFNKKTGGITGDILGAISEVTEIKFLLAVILWSRLFI